MTGNADYEQGSYDLEINGLKSGATEYFLSLRCILGLNEVPATSPLIGFSVPGWLRNIVRIAVFLLSLPHGQSGPKVAQCAPMLRYAP